MNKLEAIGFKREALVLAREENRLSKLFKSAKRDRLIAPNSHFQRGLDSTIALPKEVNEYDCVIEGVMRPKAVSILQSVCYGKDPYLATAEFVTSMRQFFDSSYKATLRILADSYPLTRKAKRFVRSLGKRGNGDELLHADLEIIRQQRRATALPPRALLDLGMSIEDQKLLILRG